MSTDDRRDKNEVAGADAQARVQDLNPTNLDEQAAQQVKGGGKVKTSDIHVTKPTDSSSP